ncbi:transglutaminase TgpA family protein [Actinoplanes aureus]|uniref:Transglutaminase domain-containing protein n=1 Tax=Actinoplanes aureus TaxID=2792083 RepID=A0A931CC83_9ACTN|nr:DUF3488 and transglutaminase-like domain-containing protein [Actinoplanes aureus]MBG0563463.1 transglutaminase domain-containing protein [Actinoplanes aureus]
MTGRRRLGLVAAGATLLAAAPLSAIFDSWTWLLQSLLTVLLIAGAAVGARTLRFPTWAQILCMIVGLALALTWIFPSGKEILIPQPATFAHFADLIRQAGEDTRSYGVPVPDRDGLHFVTVLGIGAVAILVDVLTAVFRRPALAGLPMLAIYSIPVAVYLDSVPVIPFIIGAAGYMWLLVADNVDRVRRFGRRFTGDGRDVDVWEPSPLAAAGRRMGVLGVLVAVLLPLAVPTVSGGLLSRWTQSGGGVGPGIGGGGGGRINLFAALSGQLNQTATVNLIKVTTNEPEPFYLRFAVADALTTNGFSNESPRGPSLAEGLPDPRQAASQANFAQFRAEVEVSDALRQSMVPLYTYPAEVRDLEGNWSYDPGQQVLFSGRSTTGEQKYSFTYQRARYNRSQLRTAQPLDRDDPLRKYTEAPDDPSVENLVARLIRNEDSEYDKVRAIYESFSAKNGFRYDVATESSGNATDIASFLKNKVGYCQQYAAAMAWMVRAAGIPARVAFGFTRGTAVGNGTYQITNKNAHAWTEVYLDGFGWVPFDATPAAGVAGSTRTAWAQDVDRPEPTASASAGPTGPDTESSAAPTVPQRPEQGNDGGGALAGDGVVPDDGSWMGAMIAGGVALVIALLLIPAMRRALLRRRRHSATTGLTATAVPDGDPGPAGTVTDIVVTSDSVRARADAHAAWDELIDTMIDFRVPVDPTETPRHTAQRLIRETELAGDASEAATLLGTAEERARYARRPLQGAELVTAIGRVRSGVARSATFRTRMQALLLPPSVLLNWRLALGEWSTRTAEAMTRMRDSLSRFSPRRLLSRAR